MANLQRYKAGIVPNDVAQLQRFLQDELNRLQVAIASINDGMRDVLNVEPAKKYEGMTVTADGTDWNPGSGGGTYQWRSGAWQFLG